MNIIMSQAWHDIKKTEYTRAREYTTYYRLVQVIMQIVEFQLNTIQKYGVARPAKRCSPSNIVKIRADFYDLP